MPEWLNKIFVVALRLAAAGMAALWLVDFAHNHLQIPRDIIRTTATAIGGILFIALYSDRFGKRK